MVREQRVKRTFSRTLEGWTGNDLKPLKGVWSQLFFWDGLGVTPSFD